MSGSRLHGPDGNGADTRDRHLSLEERRVALQMREAHKARITAPPLVTCDPQGKDDDVKLEKYLRATVEPELRDQAGAAEAEGKQMAVVTALSDKSHLNPIRLLGGEECGDKAILAFSDATAYAMGDVEAANGGAKTALYLTRVAPRSDEGIIVIGGPALPENAHVQFEMALDIERRNLDRSAYTYRVDVEGPHAKETYDLSLEGFSRILRHPEMVLAGHFKVTRPAMIRSGVKSGFILDEVRRLENSEANCFDRLPKLYSGNGGLPEVRTPFKGSLKSSGERRMTRGMFIEIKLEMSPEHAAAFLPFTKDRRDDEGNLVERGTRKGFAEIYSLRLGMRFLNTFFGKARTNSILTPITHAMADIERGGISVVPVSGGYLQYWLDAPDCASTAEMVEKALSARINCRTPTDDPGHIGLKFRPSLLTMDAAGIDLDEVRARFILKSLGKDLYPVEVLGRADFLVNFLEHVHPMVQQEVLTALAMEENGGRRVTLGELDTIKSIKWLCSMRRTIRDTEDLVWTLRNDSDLPPEIRADSKRIELGFWEFASERYKKIRYLLTRMIQREMNRNGYQG